MAHQVLEEYNSLPTTNHKQGATKLLNLLKKYLLMVTLENAKTIWFNLKFSIIVQY